MHCAAGANRSASVVLSYIVARCRCPLITAAQWLWEVRPIIGPRPQHAARLIDLERAVFGAASCALCDLEPGRLMPHHRRLRYVFTGAMPLPPQLRAAPAAAGSGASAARVRQPAAGCGAKGAGGGRTSAPARTGGSSSGAAAPARRSQPRSRTPPRGAARAATPPRSRTPPRARSATPPAAAGADGGAAAAAAAASRRGTAALASLGYAYQGGPGGETRLCDAATGAPVGDGEVADFASVAAACMDWCHGRMLGTGMEWAGLATGGLVLRSTDAATNAKGLLVLITGTGSVRAGVWGRGLLVALSAEHGCCLPMLRRARERGWAAVAFDPNGGDAAGDGEKGFHHCVDAWHATVDAAAAARVFVVAHSLGGACLVECLDRAAPQSLRRIAAVAFTDSVHYVSGDHLQLRSGRIGAEALAVLRDRAVAWVADPAGALDVVQYEFNADKGCRCVFAGTADHAATNAAAEASIFAHFDRHAT